MKCPVHGTKMTVLFYSVVCDACSPPGSVKIESDSRFKTMYLALRTGNNVKLGCSYYVNPNLDAVHSLIDQNGFQRDQFNVWEIRVLSELNTSVDDCCVLVIRGSEPLTLGQGQLIKKVDS